MSQVLVISLSFEASQPFLRRLELGNSFGVIASERGVVVGPLSFVQDGFNVQNSLESFKSS